MQKLSLHAILSPSVFTVSPDAPLADVLASMESLRISCVIATDGTRLPLGIFTEQDAIRLMAERRIIPQLRMADVMSVPPLTAPADLDFRDAYRLLSEKGFRHLVVTDEQGKLLGVVSEADFLHHMGMEYLVELKTVGSAMTQELVTLHEDATLADAVDLMNKHKISCVIVTREQRPLGILTERDTVVLARTVSDPTQVHITRVMKSPVLSVDTNLPLQQAMQQMEASHIRRLVVIEGEILAGIVTRHDIVKSMQGRYLEFLHETLERQRNDLKNAQQQLETNRQKMLYHSLIEQVNDAVIVSQEADGKIVDCNDQTCRSLGYTREELLLLTIFDIATTITAGNSWQFEREIFRRDGERTIETQHRRRDGSLYPVEVNARLVQRDNEKFIVAVARDLTERKQTEARLRLQNTALNSTANAIVITDKDAVIQWTNPAFSKMTGYALDEAIGKRPKDLVSSGIQPREFYEALWNTILSGLPWNGEVVNKRKDGSLYTEEMTITPVYAEDKVITHFIAVKQDISERKANEVRLAQSETTYRGIINSISEAVYVLNEKGEFIDVNRGAEVMYGYTREELIGLTPTHVGAPGKNDLAATMTSVKQAFAGLPQHFEFWGKRKDGTVFPKSVNLVKGEYFGQAVVIAVARDITIPKEAEEHLREAAAVMQSTHEGVMIADASANLIAVNAAFSTITGYSAQEALGQNPRMLSSGRQTKAFYEAMWITLIKNGYWQGEMWNRRKSGEIYPQLLTISTIYNDQRQPLRYIGLFVDITQLKENQAQLEFMAHHDPLTQLPNRALAESRLEQELEQAHRHNLRLSVLFIDLDRFKQVNDSFGHLVGDELLCAVANKLRERLREGDTLGRLGGDEFILIASPLKEKQDAAIIARDLINALSEPFQLSNGIEVFIGGSIGISLFPDNGASVSELTKNADAAMYLAKDNGRNQFSFYTPELNAGARDKLEMENDLRRAVLHNELSLHYQAKVDIRDGKIYGAEALARWQKPDGHWVPPDQFIPLAERSGVILTIGNWVIEKACEQIRDWTAQGLPGVCIAVNVSARQFRSGHLDKLVATALNRFNVDPQRLELELTESMLVHDPESAINTMQRLKQIGVKLSLDDFGTGYSNFAYLRRFPIDSLKIDQSFVQGVTDKPEDAMIVDAIISLAKRMDLRVIGEGVETLEQLNYLRDKQCDELQGYYFSHALPPEQFALLLRSGKTLLV